MDNAAGLLGLAKKAGKIEIGEESVSTAVRQGRARLIMSAGDASASSAEHAKNLAAPTGIVSIVLPYEKSDLGALLGRGSPGILALTDLGLALSFVEKLAAAHPGQYDDAVSLLRKKQARASERKSSAGGASGNSGKRRTNR